MAFTYVTVARDYDLATSEPPTGTVYFTPSGWMLNGGVTIAPAPRPARLDADGIVAITLVANTDPGTTPVDTTYTVREVIDGQPERTYEVVIPHDLGSALSLGTNMALLTEDEGDARYQPVGGQTVVVSNTQTGTSYTLVLSDAGVVVEMNNAAANTVTVPPNSSVAYPVGTYLHVRQYGAGQTALAPGSGVTLRSRNSALKLAGQYAEATLTKRAADEWVVTGEVIP